MRRRILVTARKMTHMAQQTCAAFLKIRLWRAPGRVWLAVVEAVTVVGSAAKYELDQRKNRVPS
jgi:hypothetical protein